MTSVMHKVVARTKPVEPLTKKETVLSEINTYIEQNLRVASISKAKLEQLEAAVKYSVTRDRSEKKTRVSDLF